ncbi:MAG: sucrase ferredoxin [Caldilineaceae bacterium]|nr:sucrase ferredoxin [Caldilineaceae bacterium]
MAKQRASAGDGAVTFFVALAHEEHARLYRFELASCEDLLTFDLTAVIARAPIFDANVHDEPLFLVCTNGRRDLCCAKFGLPVYAAMAEYATAQTWRTSHIGGHRFAPTLVALPHGLIFGRVTTDEVATLVDAYRDGSIYDLDRLRGRSCYPPIVQAADGYLRKRSGIRELNAFRFDSLKQIDESAWDVLFSHRTTHAVHTILSKR